jgi:putative transposase
MKEYLTVSEIRELYKLTGKSITERAIQLGIKRGKYPTAQLVNHNKVGQGGKIWQISIEDPGIPSEIKDQYYKKHFETQNSNPIADGEKATTKIEPSADLLSGRPQEQGNSPALCGHSQEQGYLFPAPDFFSEKAKKIALARVDLINAWKEYRKDHKKVTDADNKFLDIYNSNIFYKSLHGVLGNISIKTLYRWSKELAGTKDWSRLVPNYEKRELLNKEEEKAFLSVLLRPGKFRIGTAITMTKIYLKKEGIPSEKSDRTFRRFAKRYKAKHYDSWVLARQGQKALKDKVAPFVRRDPSLLEVGDVLIADGHRLNFQTINPFTGKPCRAVLVGFLDWKSHCLAGYEIMLEENTQCILSALRDSILRLGKIPKHTYQDNGKAFRSRFFTSTESFEELGFYGLLGRLGIVPVFAKPYNARAKPIERWFKDFSNTFEKLMPSYVGNSIENKPPRMLRNENFHKALHKERIPKIEEIIQRIEIWLEWQRSQPCPHVEGKTIGQVFDDGKGPGININDLDDLMMEMKITKIGQNGIRLCNQEYYDKALYGLRENVLVRYSIFDLSYLKVFSMSGEFLCIANRVQPTHPMANHLGTPKDMEELKQKLSEHRKLEKKTTQDVRRLIKTGRPIELEWEKVTDLTPRIVGKLEKETLSLSDSFKNIQEAMKEFMKYMADTGVFFSHEDREAIEKEIIKNNLDRAFVRNFALTLRGELAKRYLILHEPENPENYSPIFQYGWQKYEFLKTKRPLTEEEKRWIEDYKEGRILSGEYEEIYIKSKQQNDIDSAQTLDKREEAL